MRFQKYPDMCGWGLNILSSIWFSCRPDMRKLCLHEVFHTGMTFHAGMKRRDEIFMLPRNESFISPRHHVNTTVAQTSTRYENSCRHVFLSLSNHVESLEKFLNVFWVI